LSSTARVYRHGASLVGELREVRVGEGEGTALLVMESGVLSAGAEVTARLEPGDVVVLATRAVGAHAGAPSDFFPETKLPQTLVPKTHAGPPSGQALLALYGQALAALRSALGSDVVPVFERVHRELSRDFPHDWLLRWNLLESLLKLGAGVSLAERLARELEELEVHHQYRQPIASGLRYLQGRAVGS
jgi:hypothetical protein